MLYEALLKIILARKQPAGIASTTPNWNALTCIFCVTNPDHATPGFVGTE